MLRPITPRKVNFADAVDSKNCTTCDALFTIVCLKHTCKACNKEYCGKCSKSNVTTVGNALIRERLCNCCANTKAATKAQFTPSKLNLLDGNAASKLWSADSDSDSDSNSDSDGESTEKCLLVGHCLTDDFVTDQENNEIVNMPHAKDVQSNDKLRTASTFDLTPAQHKLLRSLCDASFSDNASGVSSVSSKAPSSAAKSPFSGLSSTCTACQTTFDDIARRHMCSHCTKMVCGGCSTTHLLVRDQNVLRHRVCKTCQPTLADAPFTPGKLHLLNQQATGTGSNVTHRRQLQNRLWSADTDSDSDDSTSDSARMEEDEVDLLAESVAENLLDDIEGEETNRERVLEDEKESQEGESEHSGNASAESDVCCELQTKPPISKTQRPKDSQQVSRAPLFMLMVALLVMVLAALWTPVAASILTFEGMGRVIAHEAPIAAAFSEKQLLAYVAASKAPVDVSLIGPLPSAVTESRSVAEPEPTVFVKTFPESAVAEMREEPKHVRTETKLTMLLYSPSTPTPSEGQPRAMARIAQALWKLTQPAKANTALVCVRTRLGSAFSNYWRHVNRWMQRAHTSSLRLLSRVLNSSQRAFVK